MERKSKKKCVKIFLMFLFGFFFISSGMYAQGGTITIKGNVKDNNGEPIISGSVVVKGTTNGTVTDLDGNYQINAPSNGTLVFSYVGFKTQEIPIGGKTQINVKLVEDAVALGEVIAIGYATGSKYTVSGTIDRIKKEDMNAGVVSNPLDALKGKVAGVNIAKVGGDPAATPNIRIRGTTSLSGGNDPLVIIDGVFGDLGMMNSLSPSDIESFTILKDASETAQYGSRGASGVIVITTQKGKFGAKSLSYDGSFGVESIYKNIKMLDGPVFRQALKDRNITNNTYDQGNNTNFFEEMEQTGYTQNHNISFGGGTEESNYKASLGIIDSKGIIKDNYARNYTTKIDVSQYFFDKKLQLQSGIFGSKANKRYINDYRKTFYSAAGMNPTYSNTVDKDGNWIQDPNALEIDNPLGRLTITDKEDNAYVIAHARATWNIVEGLKLSAFGSYTYNDKENSIYIPRNIRAGKSDSGIATKRENKTSTLLGNISLNYKKNIGVHALDLLGLVEGQEYNYNGFEATSRGFETDYMLYNNLLAGKEVRRGDVKSHNNGYKLMSYLGRANYVYNDRYIATVNLRADGSSKLGKNEKWGFFPSVSGAWIISNESFIKDNTKSINNLKFRISYGVVGNQDAIEPYNSLMSLVPNESLSSTGDVTYRYDRNENPDLRWETKKTFNVGFDASFLQERLSMTFDYYHSVTSDLLYTYAAPQPPFVMPTILANIGEMANDGFELSMTILPIKTKDMELSISPNFSYQKNKLLSLKGSFRGYDFEASKYMPIGGISGAGSIGGNTNAVYHIVGQPLGVFYLPKTDGFIPNDEGDGYRYNVLDIDGVPGIDLADDKDRYIAGQSMPKYYLGTNIKFAYKNFDIQTQLNGAFGHKIYNGTSLTYMNMNSFPTYNVLNNAPEVNIKDKENPVTDFWLEKGDYLNIAYLSLGYNINTANWGKWVKSMRVTASINNLYTFTEYSGLSPMINSTTVNDNLGIDDKRFYPLSRTYSVGLSLNF